MKTAMQKHAGGRPKKTLVDLPKTWVKNTLELAAEGGSDVEIRVHALGGISRDLWYRFLDGEPEFSDTIKKAHDLCEAWWMEMGRAGALGKLKLNPTIWIFNMKNRFGWRDQMALQHSGPGSELIDIEVRYVDMDGSITDRSGNRLDKDGNLFNQDGNPINADGSLIKPALSGVA